MGQAIAATVDRSRDLLLSGVWQRGSDLDAMLSDADVVIDFSLPDGTVKVVSAAVRNRKPLVCGVSGLTESQMKNLAEASRHIPLVYDRNMSLGIAVLERLVSDAARALGSDFDIQVSEVHHVHKKDAPSGTALKLAEAIAAARKEASTHSISFAVERRDEVPGYHEIVMKSATESLTLAHSVTTRQVFVDGALRAARWAADRPCGLYSMQDVLFSENSTGQSAKKVR
jgi:4-hydroxy-tetrahydrodipicolinate reductase